MFDPEAHKKKLENLRYLSEETQKSEMNRLLGREGFAFDLKEFLEDVPKDIDVLVVDGGSIDETVEVARKYRVRVIRQKFGRGKGCGARTGMEFFTN
jgi:hypothetical protein